MARASVFNHSLILESIDANRARAGCAERKKKRKKMGEWRGGLKISEKGGRKLIVY